jgi:hypothetical protein
MHEIRSHHICNRLKWNVFVAVVTTAETVVQLMENNVTIVRDTITSKKIVE